MLLKTGNDHASNKCLKDTDVVSSYTTAFLDIPQQQYQFYYPTLPFQQIFYPSKMISNAQPIYPII